MTEQSTDNEGEATDGALTNSAKIAQLKRWLQTLPKNQELTPIAILCVIDLIDSGCGPVGVVEDRDETMRDLTIPEFARLMGRSPCTAMQWCAGSQVPGAYKLQGRAWRIPRKSVQRFKDEQSRPKPRPTSLMSAVHLLQKNKRLASKPE